jgi:hypothetical protein
MDRGRKTLSGRAEEQEKGVGAVLRRADGFGAPPASAAAPGVSNGGFGRRATPIPSTTNGMPPRAAANDGTVANDRAAPADDGIELSFAAEQSVEATETRTVASDESDPLTSELVDWLQFELRRGRDIQQEAVLCALGALAGYAAQQAIREALVKTGKLTLDQAFAVIETRSGEVFFFGELLNAVIVANDGARNSSSGNGAAGGHASIWKIVSDGGRDAGAINLPDVTDIIKNCAATVGRDEFGIPRVADAHMPNILPREAVSRFWPAARRKLAGKDPMSWPLHLALAARSLIVSLKHAVRPDIAVQIVMEAAVPMSKIDPVSLPKE